jgi:hypothetical protein
MYNNDDHQGDATRIPLRYTYVNSSARRAFRRRHRSIGMMLGGLAAIACLKKQIPSIPPGMHILLSLGFGVTIGVGYWLLAIRFTRKPKKR